MKRQLLLDDQEAPRRTMSNHASTVEISPFSGKLYRGGVTVDVQIFKHKGDTDWCLEVIEQTGTITAFNRRFTTDGDACLEFHRILDTQGPRAFLEPPATQH